MHAAAVLALLALLPPLPAALDTSCVPASCGNLSIRYPFWLRGRQPPSCGYPSFGIDCDPAGAPPLLSDSYLRLLDIHYGNSSVVAFHTNLADDPTSGCRATKFNMSSAIVLSLLTISRANWELFLCGNCARRLPAEWLPMNCSMGSGAGAGGAQWFLYLSHDEPGGGAYQEIAAAGCQYSAVPVMPGSELRAPGDYAGLVRRGFLLEWKVPGDCAACEASGGGQCRFDAGENAFRCLCPDGSNQPATCARGEFTDPMISYSN
ncbi:unnamed protein product [Urochloa decumbens]|uniref:Wall-associated receptor kinase galacturonan-binding domain-containing protein n=1 Tax=Urochloa decumbens TaxID=240449 RepID=A0ABC8ZT07_9POAL